MNVRAFPVAVADVQPGAFARNTGNAVIDRLHVPLDTLDETGIVKIAVHHGTVHGEVWCIDLQNQSGFMDRLIFVFHLSRDRAEVVVMRFVVRIEHGG